MLFPIFDPKGRICGFGGRIIGEGQPKYMNSPESPVFDKSRLLLGLYQQASEIRSRQRVVLVEGNFDMVSLVVHGCPNVVAPLGTALTRPQLRLLRHYTENVILLFDGDPAGIKAAVRAVPLFLAEQMSARVALLPAGHDPDTFVREKGLEELERLLDAATPLAEFALTKMIEEHGLTLDGKSRIVEELRPLVEAAASPLQRSVVVAHFSEKLGMDARQLNELLTTNVPSASPMALDAGPQRKETNRWVPEERKNTRLSGPQRRLVSYMVRYPGHFPRLEEAGIRQRLAEGIGEVLFLQMKALHAGNPGFEPEDLLAVLPEGEERSLVVEIQMATQAVSESGLSSGTEEELAELLLWLKRQELEEMKKSVVAELIRLSPDASEERDRLLLQVEKINKELHALDESA